MFIGAKFHQQYTDLTLKKSLGVADHSKIFCDPKKRLRNKMFHNHIILSEIPLSLAFDLISITSTKIYVYYQNDTKSVHELNAFLSRSRIFHERKRNTRGKSYISNVYGIMMC